MTEYTTRPEAVLSFVRKLAQQVPVFFPQPHGKQSFRFAPVTLRSALAFEGYRPTVVPPARLLLPSREALLSFRKAEGGAMEVAAPLDDARRVLCGVRPCDLKGIALLDQIQTEGVPDPYYLARRARTTIVAYRCAAPCDARAFCAAVDSLDHDEGADVLLTPLGSAELLVTARTPAGAALVADAGFDAVADGPARRVGAVAARQEPFGRALPRKVSALPAVLAGRYKSALWEKHVARCFSCGTCNLVCPTCYCFDVKDDLALDTVSGTRHRTLDACMLPHFAEVAGGHNFRPEPAARQRHRVKRKFEYLPARLGAGSACVGCGRCGRQCTAGIDIYDIVCDLVAEESKS